MRYYLAPCIQESEVIHVKQLRDNACINFWMLTKCKWDSQCGLGSWSKHTGEKQTWWDLGEVLGFQQAERSKEVPAGENSIIINRKNIHSFSQMH